jgi:hypothetical protein
MALPPPYNGGPPVVATGRPAPFGGRRSKALGTRRHRRGHVAGGTAAGAVGPDPPATCPRRCRSAGLKQPSFCRVLDRNARAARRRPRCKGTELDGASPPRQRLVIAGCGTARFYRGARRTARPGLRRRQADCPTRCCSGSWPCATWASAPSGWPSGWTRWPWRRRGGRGDGPKPASRGGRRSVYGAALTFAQTTSSSQSTRISRILFGRRVLPGFKLMNNFSSLERIPIAFTIGMRQSMRL